MEKEAYFLYVFYTLTQLPPKAEEIAPSSAKAASNLVKKPPSQIIRMDDLLGIPKPRLKYIYPFELTIKRASMQRRDGGEDEGVVNSRVNIEFDPLQKALGYVVVIRGFKDNGSEIAKNVVHICGVFLEEDAARKFKLEIEDGGYRNYMSNDSKRREFYDYCEIHPALISER